MKKLAYFLLIGSAFASCMKKVDEVKVSNDFSSVAVINASPASVANSLNGNLFVDGVLQTGSAVGYRTSSGYLSVRPGSRNLSFVAATADSARLFERNGEAFESGKAYTYVVYDTVPNAQTGNARRLRSIRLTDDLSTTGKSANAGYVRILHLAPNAPAVDVTFVRTNVATPDSVTVSNLTYIGASPTQAQLNALSNFNVVLPLGFAGNYTIRVKAAGTQNVLAGPTAANFTTQAINQSFSTLYITGTAQGQGASLGLFRHYP